MPIIIRYVLDGIVLYEGHLDTLCVFCVSCKRLQLCSYEVSEISKNVVWMPDQSIYDDRGV